MMVTLPHTTRVEKRLMHHTLLDSKFLALLFSQKSECLGLLSSRLP